MEYSVSIGDSCTADDDCVNALSNEVTCVNSVCVGQNAGGNCTNSASCNFGLYCADNDLCAAQLMEGDACDTDNDNCGYPTVCGTGSKCTKAFTAAKGAACIVDEECMVGNACVNMKCATPPSAKACSNDTDCPTSQGYTGSCDCDSTGKSMCSVESALITTCYSQIQSYYDCVVANSCPSIDMGSPCVVKNCNNEAQCYYSCGLQASGASADCFPSLTCSSSTTSSDAVSVASVSVGLAAVAAAALFV
jgi:hypothetical protein